MANEKADKISDLNMLHLNNSHLRVIYLLHSRCVKALNSAKLSSFHMHFDHEYTFEKQINK